MNLSERKRLRRREQTVQRVELKREVEEGETALGVRGLGFMPII